MSKLTANTGGITSRCRLTTLLFITLIAFTFVGSVQAQDPILHGVAMAKGCTGPVRTCRDNSDCGNDDQNACTAEKCDLNIQPFLICQFEATHNDEDGDILNLTEAWDMIDPFGDNNGPTRWPNSGNSPIINISGVAVCTSKADDTLSITENNFVLNAGVGNAKLPCTIGPVGASTVGKVKFLSAGYVPVLSDADPVPDMAFVKVVDTCAPGWITIPDLAGVTVATRTGSVRQSATCSWITVPDLAGVTVTARTGGIRQSTTSGWITIPDLAGVTVTARTGSIRQSTTSGWITIPDLTGVAITA